MHDPLLSPQQACKVDADTRPHSGGDGGLVTRRLGLSSATGWGQDCVNRAIGNLDTRGQSTVPGLSLQDPTPREQRGTGQVSVQGLGNLYPFVP